MKKIIKMIFPDKETRKKSLKKSLETTIDQIVKETDLKKPDQYFLRRLHKQYTLLTRDARKYGMNLQNYENKLEALY